jgi:5'-nucleotidase
MKLLVTNDDGIMAKGIFLLAKELEKEHEVIIIAPDNQRSASSHSITLSRPLVVKEVKIAGLKSKAYSVDGTPADCVRVGISNLFEGKVDMVVSGINRGYNIGTDVLYSGTVSAAIEGAVYKVPSLAVSTGVTDEDSYYETAALYAANILLKAQKYNMPNDFVLNLNVPIVSKNDFKGIKVCKIGSRTYDEYYVETIGEDGHRNFELKGNINDVEANDADTYFIKEGYATLTPLHYDFTNFKILKEVGEWFQ